jgi:hypothetical protein
MAEKRLILILAIVIAIFLCIGTVNATEVTMRVDSKHIIGMGSGNAPFDVEGSINVVYVISEMKEDTCGNSYVLQEYPVSIQDYCKIKTGQTVTLEVPDSRVRACKVVKIE